MKNKSRIFFAFLFTIVVAVFFYSERVFNGDPVLRKESKEIVTEYLQKKYPEITFIIKDQVDYIDVIYWVSFISEDGKVEGSISVYKGRIYYWGEELGQILTMEQSKEVVLDYLHSNYPEQTFSIKNGTYSEGNYIFQFISKDTILQGKIGIGVRDQTPSKIELFKNGIEISTDQFK